MGRCRSYLLPKQGCGIHIPNLSPFVHAREHHTFHDRSPVNTIKPSAHMDDPVPHQGDRVEPTEEPPGDVGVVVVGEEGGVPGAQLGAAPRTEVMLVVGMVVGRLEVDGAHVVRLEVLPQALLPRLALLKCKLYKVSSNLVLWFVPGKCFPALGCSWSPGWIRWSLSTIDSAQCRRNTSVACCMGNYNHRKYVIMQKH